MDEKDILSLISNGENAAVEFKQSAIKPDQLAKEMVAFSNTQGGTILLGIEDSGQLVGVVGNLNYEEWSMNVARNNVVPAIELVCNEYQIQGKRIIALQIPKGKDRPYQTLSGKYLVRIGSTNRQATQPELMRLFQQAGFFHYDLTSVERTSFKDINLTAVDQYFSRYNIDFSQESEGEKVRLLQNTDILNANGKATVGGLTIFGINPQRYLPNASISFAHFQGKNIGDTLIDKQIIDGTLPNQIDRAVAILKNNIQKPSTIKGAKRVDTHQTYEDAVFRELVTNACVHRNYALTGAAIRIFLFANRMEFISPGRLPNTVTIEKLKVGVSFAINPVIVKFMENLRYIDKIGRGLPMVYQAAKSLGKQIEFKEVGEEFRVVLEL
ncbi:MAG: RNA-binding domain-containing protein [Bacteroidota bacterium]